MAIRFAHAVVRRAQLPLTQRDLDDLAALHAPTPQRAALVRLVPEGIADQISESALLHALLELALARVREETEAAGYAELARLQDDDARRRVARRRKPGWADDE
jgi:hypothetical protein